MTSLDAALARIATGWRVAWWPLQNQSRPWCVYNINHHGLFVQSHSTGKQARAAYHSACERELKGTDHG